MKSREKQLNCRHFFTIDIKILDGKKVLFQTCLKCGLSENFDITQFAGIEN